MALRARTAACSSQQSVGLQEESGEIDCESAAGSLLVEGAKLTGELLLQNVGLLAVRPRKRVDDRLQLRAQLERVAPRGLCERREFSFELRIGLLRRARLCGRDEVGLAPQTLAQRLLLLLPGFLSVTVSFLLNSLKDHGYFSLYILVPDHEPQILKYFQR